MTASARDGMGIAALGAATALPRPARLPARVGAATPAHQPSERTCAPAPAGYAACLARVVVNSKGTPRRPRLAADATPAGYGPADIQSAYNLSGASGAGQTVAIVDAYDDPTAEADLATYRSTYGLPACTPGNGCFSKVDQNGGTELPGDRRRLGDRDQPGPRHGLGGLPDCNILLVEADSASFADLGTAVNTAASLGAVAISNSYGGSDSGASSDYDHPGIAVTASTGDGGYGVESPASFDTVVAVGGTSLTRTAARGWTRVGLERRRQRLLDHQREAVVADRRHPVQRQGQRRRLGRRRPVHRRRGLRLDALPGPVRLAGLRRDQRVVADHRQRLRDGRVNSELRRASTPGRTRAA